MQKTLLYGLVGWPLKELRGKFITAGLPSHQADLLFQAIHRHKIFQAEAIEGFGKKGVAFLRQLPSVQPLELIHQHKSTDETIKLGWRLSTGQIIESVLIPRASGRVTLCISSQAGCAVGCPFCSTGFMGFKKNLSSTEIILQYLQSCEFSTAPIQNIVFMGMGEPLHNEEEVLKACRIFTEDFGVGFAKRRVSVSTSGIVPKIKEIWKADTCSLAISLHATTDEIRNTLVPLNKKWNLESLQGVLSSLRYRKHDSIMIEYLLLHKVNDTPEDAYRLVKWCEGFPCKINLLHFNSFEKANYQSSSPERIDAFQNVLQQEGAFYTFRFPRGRDVQAACGQLAYHEEV